MSRILQKLKGKSLFQQLGETFSTEVVNPYGEVLIIPSNQFKNEWQEKLEAEGIQTFMSNYGNQACFLLRKKKQSQASSVIEKSPVQKVEGDSKPSLAKKKLTPEETARVKQLYDQRLSGKEIAKKLGCSIQTIGGVIRHYKKSKEKHEETKSKSNDPEIVKELLSACSLLYPSHREACLFLLKEITVRMAVGLNE